MSNSKILKIYCRLCCLWLFYCCANVAYSQTQHDSLLYRFHYAEDDLDQGLILSQLIELTHLSDIDTSKYYLSSLDSIAKQSNIDTLQLLAFLYGAELSLLSSKYSETDSLLSLLGQRLDTAAHSKLLGEYFDLKSYYHYLNYEFDHAAEFAHLAVKSFSKIDDKIGMAIAGMHIGSSMHKVGNYEKARKYYREAEALFLKYDPNNHNIGTIYNGFAVIHYLQNEYLDAVPYFKKFLEIAENNSIVKNIVTGNNNVAVSFIQAGHFEEARPYLDKALDIGLKEKVWRPYIAALSSQGQYYIATKNYKEAIKSLKHAIEINERYSTKSQPDYIYRNIYQAYKLDGDHKNALVYHERYEHYKDSILNLKRMKEIEELDVQYQTVKKDAEISQQQLLIERQEHQQNILWGSIILISLLALSVFLFMKHAQKKNRLITNKDLQLKSQKITQLEKEKKILTMSSMIKGQEEERKRIAQDLHDGLGGLLASVKTKFAVIQNQITALESLDVYNEANKLLDNACTEVRKIAHNMMPDALSKLGLIEAVKDTAEQFGEMNVDVIDLGMHVLDDTQKVMIYRVIQEFLNNTRKHAVASQVIIQFYIEGDDQLIYLEDDGGGFDKFNVNSKGIGIKSMESRINYIGGTLDLESIIGVGTTMTIKVPKEG